MLSVTSCVFTRSCGRGQTWTRELFVVSDGVVLVNNDVMNTFFLVFKFMWVDELCKIEEDDVFQLVNAPLFVVDLFFSTQGGQCIECLKWLLGK